MTPRQAKLIQKSFARLRPNGKMASKIFYDRLFEIAPETRALFPEDMSLQYHKFMSMLGTLVSSLHRFDELVPAVRELGQRHGTYRVRDEHFGAVGEALIAMLEHGFGPSFTPELKYAWTAGYWRLALVMLDAADLVALEERDSKAASLGNR